MNVMNEEKSTERVCVCVSPGERGGSSDCIIGVCAHIFSFPNSSGSEL